MEDPRYRTRTYLTAYYESANVLEDDDVTEATVINCYSNPNYPLKLVFDTKNIDGIYSVGTPTSNALPDWRGYIYAYDEEIPIEIFTCDKTGITGTNLRWSMENELRRIVQTYPLYGLYGTYRTISRMAENEQDMGGWKLYSVKYLVPYLRANDDYTSTVTLSYTAGFIYDGDRLTSGAEGDWTLNAGGSTATQDITYAPGHLRLDITNFVDDVYTINGTNIDKSTTLYGRIRLRYRTTSNATAKVILVFDDASTQTVLSETAASTFKVLDTTITTAKTLDHIKLYACDGTGSVYYDFIQVYKGNFTFPNVASLTFTPPSRNLRIPAPSRIGNIPQNLGADDATIELTCNLDVETDTYSWKRDGDVDAGDIFLDVCHNHGTLQPFQWLVWGNKQCKVTLDEPSFSHEGNTRTLRLRFTEYSSHQRGSEYYYQRWSLDT